MKTAVSLVAFLVLVGFSQTPPKSVQVISSAFGPSATVLVSRPTIVWQIWSRSASVTHVEMFLDSEQVSAKYDVEQRSILYTPAQALAAGPHHVLCQATFGPGATYSKTWDMTVAPDAVSSLPAASEVQNDLLKAMNAQRRGLGLPALAIDDRLNAAAAAHTSYLNRTGELGHDESPGNPGFIGKTGGQRAQAFGWCLGCYEGISIGEHDAASAIRSLFDAPYHRIPFMQPGSPSFGGDSSNSRTTIMFGMTRDYGVTVSPADGQKDVPLAWENFEEPSPLRDRTESHVAGYPIVIAEYSPTLATLRLVSSSLQTLEGESVPIWLQTATNDEFLKNAAILIPREPLKRGTTYVVTAEISYEGHAQTKNWKFTTER